MKRLVSLLLALMMLATLIPAAFAAEDSGVRIVYDLSGIIADNSSNLKDSENYYSLANLNYQMTNGFFKFVDGGTTDAEGNKGGTKGVGGAFRVENKTGVGAFLAVSSNSLLALEIVVPKAGVYDLEMYTPKTNYVNNAGTTPISAQNTVVNVYISKDGVSTAAADLKGSYNTWEEYEGEQYVAVTEPRVVEGIAFSEAGKYVITFKPNCKNWTYQTIGTFILNGGDAYVPMLTDVNLGKSEISVGEETEISVTAEYMSDGKTLAEGVTYSYESSDEKIAKADENGKITGIGMGIAKITVTAAKDGGTLSRTVDVKVTDPDSAKISLTYNFSSLMIGWKETDPGFASLTFDKTNDLNAYYDNSAGHLGHHSDNQWFKGAQTDSTGAQRGLQLAYPNVWYAATIRVPVSGKYIASVDYAKYKTSTGYLGVYLLKKDENLTREQIERSLTDETLLKTVYEVDSSATAVTWQEEPAELGILDLDAGEYYVVFKQQGGNSYAWFGDFHLDGLGSETAPIITDCTSEKTAFKINETAAIETAVRYITDGSSAEGVVYTYKSSDPAVAEVNADGVITAKSAGNATITITATAENATLAGTREIDITVEADKPATVSDKVSFIATANIDTDISVTGISYNGGIASVLRGEKIAIEAPEVDGYTFVGWKRGSNEKGRFINQPESFEMTLLTNTYLTAVYSEKPEADEKSVEYYNENGDYIATGAATESAPSVPTLAGYVFSGKWFVSEDSELDMSKLSDGITRAVAKHNAKDVAGNITLDGESLGAKGFNDEISLTATKSGFTSWKRDGKTVSYDRNYTYYAWSATAIEESTEEIPEGMKLPIVVLDKNTVDGAVMIEYDAGDYEIVEAGIVFGANATVESCDKKFTSQRNASHGQFAATADGAARGYVIYRDGGDYRVIYSD